MVDQTVRIDELTATTTVPLELDAAFEFFTAGLGSWWPREYTWSGPRLVEEIGMEEREGGMLYERGPYGFRVDFGRIVVWSPPRRLLFTWQIGADRTPQPDPDQASEVDVTFGQVNDETLVTVTHGLWERHGSDAQAYRDGFVEAWPHVLESLKTRVS